MGTTLCRVAGHTDRFFRRDWYMDWLREFVGKDTSRSIVTALLSHPMVDIGDVKRVVLQKLPNPDAREWRIRDPMDKTSLSKFHRWLGDMAGF